MRKEKKGNTKKEEKGKRMERKKKKREGIFSLFFLFLYCF